MLYGRDPQCPFAEGTAVFPRDKDQVSRQNGDADEDQSGGMKVQPDQCRNAGQNAGNPADCPEQSEFAHLLYLFSFMKRSIAPLCKVFCRKSEKFYPGRDG